MKRVFLSLLVILTTRSLIAQGPPPRHAYESRCGHEVLWVADLDAALEQARKSEKPVFWFVPTAYRTPMDRKQEVYWYMMGGLFSEPRVVSWLNENFVPLKLGFSPLVRGSEELALVPRKEAAGIAERFGLNAPSFIEPGFLILDAEGKRLAAVDRLLSFQVDWFAARMDRIMADHDLSFRFPSPPDDVLTPARDQLAKASFEQVMATLDGDLKLPSELVDEALWLRALAHHYRGEDSAAEGCWTRLARTKSKSIWTARARLELEGWGPVRRGFAGPIRFPELAAQSRDLASSRLVDVEAEDGTRIDLALDFLLRMQREDGSFDDSTYDFGGLDSLPNVHMAVTAIATRGLLEWRAQRPQEVDDAITRSLPFILDDRNLARKDTDEIIWAQIYRLHFLLRLIELDGERRKQLGDDVARIVRDLEKSQLKSGAYRHEYPNPFVTASTIVVLSEAAKAEFRPKRAALKAAGEALSGSRDDDGSFGYGMRPGSSMEFAAGRMPLCELALLLTESSDQERLAGAIEKSFAHHDLYEEVRNYDDHAPRHRIGGFFYWYDMLGRTQAILALEDAAGRRAQAARLKALAVAIQESDGSFIDSHELGKSYGTGMALTILGLLKDQKRP